MIVNMRYGPFGLAHKILVLMALASRKSSGPRVIKLFSCLTQLSIKFILLINVKMPTIVGILTVMSRINPTSECIKQERIFKHFTFYEQVKFYAQLS